MSFILAVLNVIRSWRKSKSTLHEKTITNDIIIIKEAPFTGAWYRGDYMHSF